MIDGTEEQTRRQCREFDERCRTLPEYAVYRTNEWIENNAVYPTGK